MNLKVLFHQHKYKRKNVEKPPHLNLFLAATKSGLQSGVDLEQFSQT